jgi:hypothetical protein
MENNFHLAPDSSSEEHEPPMMSSRLPARFLCGGGKNLPCSVGSSHEGQSSVAGDTEVYPPSHLS